MRASASGTDHYSLPHFMLHRNIEDASLRAARDRKPVYRMTAFADSAIGLSYAFERCPTKLILTASQSRASASCSTEGEDIVIGIDSIIIMIIVGAIAGWLAGQIVRGFGFGLIWDILIGIVGAFIGVWLLTQLGFVPFSGFIGSIINAVIGAVILLVIVGFIKR
jgi:uncharacterized membrane protein YeaQ/YmgE (transglycosylase-associated protein family)